jgi:hypothetical protein
MPWDRFKSLDMVLFKYHIVEGVAMGRVIFRMLLVAFRTLIKGMMVLVLDGTICAYGIQEGFGVVMMGHQVVSQES